MSLKPYASAQYLPWLPADLKVHARVDHVYEDALLPGYIRAATEEAEQMCQRSFMAQKWVITLDAFPAGGLELKRLPVTQVESVKYVDAAGVLQTLAGSEWSLDNKDELQAWLLPAQGKDWPNTQADRANAVEVIYHTGYALVADTETVQRAAVPEPVRAWIALRTTDLIENRQTTQTGASNVNEFAVRLLDRYRIIGV